MILENTAVIVNIVFVNPFYIYVSLFLIAAGSILMYLMVKSSSECTVEETEKNADEFAGGIRDSNGQVTSWLWVVYIGLAVWAIAYLIQHASEFANFP